MNYRRPASNRACANSSTACSSPAELLRLEARAALTRGDHATARQLLLRAIAENSRNEAVRLDLVELDLADGALDAAGKTLDQLSGLSKDSQDSVRIEALRARLQLAAVGGSADTLALAAKLAEAPADLEARLQLATALAVKQDYSNALAHLLEIVRRDRSFQDDIGRKTMLSLFTLLAAQPESVGARISLALARTLH